MEVAAAALRRWRARWRQTCFCWAISNILIFAAGALNALMGHEAVPLRSIRAAAGHLFTFQALSYVADLLPGEIRVQKNWFCWRCMSVSSAAHCGAIVRYAMWKKSSLRADGNGRAGCRGHQALFYMALPKSAVRQPRLRWRQTDIRPCRARCVHACGMGGAVFSCATQIYYDFSGYSGAIGLGAHLRFLIYGEFQLSLPCSQCAGVLAALAYLAVHLVPQLSVHSAGRQPQRQGATLVNLMVVFLCTAVARGQLAVCGLGRILRAVPDCRAALAEAGSGKAPHCGACLR